MYHWAALFILWAHSPLISSGEWSPPCPECSTLASYSQSEWEVLDTSLLSLPCRSPWRYSWGSHLHTTHSCTLSQLFGSGYNQCVPQSSCKKSLQRRKIQRHLQTSPRAQNNPVTRHLAQNPLLLPLWQATETRQYVFLSFPVIEQSQTQKASFEDFSILFHLICCLFAGEVLCSYREDLQHCPLEGVVASAQTPQRWIQVEVLCNCTAKTKEHQDEELNRDTNKAAEYAKSISIHPA